METKVKEVMNRRPRTVTPNTSIEDLLERLRGQIEDCFPVIGKNRKLLGIVTESDVLHVLQVPLRHATVGHAMIKQAMKRSASTVGEIMTRRPITVAPDMTIQESLNLMAAHKLRHLPVIEKERLVGLICLRDIIELYHVLR
jgi:acetoin utilization protein AcuB